ncbi:Ig-like domain-containing protein [Guggenheimella bovis]
MKKRILFLMILLLFIPSFAFAEGAVITYVANPPAITIPAGTDPNELILTETVRVITEDGMSLSANVKWDKSNLDTSEAGKATVKGTLTLPEDGSLLNPKNLAPSIEIIILGKKAPNIESIIPIRPISVTLGTKQDAINFPTSVTVSLEDGTEVDLKVHWNRSTRYDSQAAGKYTFSGDIVLPPDGSIGNLKGVVAAIVVEVKGKVVATVPTVSSIQNPVDVNVPFNTDKDELDLPKTVLVTLDNNQVLPLNVKWSAPSHFDKEDPKVYTFTGELELPDDHSIENPGNLKAKLNVTVMTEETLEIKDIPKLTPIEGVLGKDAKSLDIPKTVSVILSDGKTLSLPVEWTTEYNPELSEQTLFGVLELPENIKNPDNLVAEVTIQLQSEQAETSEPVDVTTTESPGAHLNPLIWIIVLVVLILIFLLYLIFSGKKNE